MKVPPLEKEMGIEVYATKSSGIRGKIRSVPEDFVVEEVLLDESKAKTKPDGIPCVTGRGRYLVCLLVKRNWDTILATRAIATHLRLEHDRISFAGMKDANALTAQHVSISRITPEQVASFKMKGLELHPLAYSNEKIHSKMLLGNQFHITIREIRHSLACIEERSGKIQDELEDAGGVPNFFGHQRFGTKRAVTHLVGRLIVKGEWERAGLTFLAKPSPFEHPQSRLVRENLWKTQDFAEAFQNFPFKLKHERTMLSHLAKNPRDFIGAFRRLPTKLCQLFVQAYQSHLFNRFLSERIKQEIALNKIQKEDYITKRDDQMCLALPLVGFKQPSSSGVQGEIERRILEEENLKPEHFRISLMPKISTPGGLRTAIMSIKGFTWTKPTKDSAHPFKRQVEFSFMLGKGSYATVVLRELMKPRNLVAAGF